MDNHDKNNLVEVFKEAYEITNKRNDRMDEIFSYLTKPSSSTSESQCTTDLDFSSNKPSA